MVYIICVLHEPITVHCTGQAWHGRGRLLRKYDSGDSSLVIYMNYISMRVHILYCNCVHCSPPSPLDHSLHCIHPLPDKKKKSHACRILISIIVNVT